MTRLVLAGAAVVALVVAARLLLPEGGLDALLRPGEATPLLVAGAFLVATLALLPTSPVALASGALLGPWVGFGVVFAAALVAGLAAWGLGRAWAERVRALLARRAPRALGVLDAHSLRGVIASRLFLLPYGPASYGLGAAGVPARAFALGTALGIAPFVFLLTSLGAALHDLSALATPAFLAPFTLALGVTLVAAWRARASGHAAAGATGAAASPAAAPAAAAFTPAAATRASEAPRAPLGERMAGAVRGGLDLAERGLARGGSFVRRPAVYHALVVALVLVGLLVRLPLAHTAEDVWNEHGDSWVFFNQAHADFLDGDVYPDGHRGSGWQLLLWVTLEAFGFEGGQDWIQYRVPPAGQAAEAALVAHALSAMLAAGVVAATYLLAREILSPPATLGAMALVALDPYLLGIATTSMSEPPYIVLFTLGVLATLRARRHPAWLLLTGALLALGHVLRINGLVAFVMLLAFAAIYLPGASPKLTWRRAAAWGAASALAFALVAAPYLAWRADHLEGPFDYGTNQRFWADDLWDMDDAWWQAYTPEHHPRETPADYFATHDWRDATLRLWQSVQWQVYDLFGVGKWPPLEKEGGLWVGTAPEGSALTPLLAALSLVAAFTALPRRRELWVVPVVLAFTFATFVWIYPLVRSVRYFSPLIPLFVVFALVGWQHLAAQVRRPRLAAFAVFGTYLLLYGANALVHVPWGIRMTLGEPRVLALALVFGAAWVALALLPLLPPAWRRLRAAAGRGARAQAEP